MKQLTYFILILILVNIGCDKESVDPSVVEPKKACDYDLGKYTLDPGSLLANPYKQDETLFYVDSLLDTMTINVLNVNKSTFSSKSVLFFYNYHVQGDTVRMCYVSDQLYANFRSEKYKFNFSLNIRTEPYHGDPRSGKFSDVMNIWVKDKEDPSRGIGVFSDIVHKQNNPKAKSYTKELVSFDVHGKTFTNVRFNDFQNPEYKLWYNNTLGIVAFTDHDGRLWRFAKKQ